MGAAHRCGADAGVDPADVPAHADGVVVPAPVTPRPAPMRPARSGTAILAADLTVVSGLGGSPGTLAADAAHAASPGVGALRRYHAGLASDQDQSAVPAALRDTAGNTAR
ncbi:hypothetical protein [Streptomyces halobius]|uniref:Uncharacterized protein n=1 Tax=Streptomyces halobius TaxID=2879846 RepID=A0ABY4MEL1_9ACTN|nr:hypothetical protein [Streptomyces halobius]UQA96143.1 hypothetical protein K9S39_33535 [Streptomyces halobius]